MTQLDQSEALSRLGLALDEAVELGQLGAKPQEPDEQAIRARRRVVGGYLFLLGYLAKNPAEKTSDDQDDSDIKLAIRAFQRDAGLADDGWVGGETWDAIQAITSFEHPTNIGRGPVKLTRR